MNRRFELLRKLCAGERVTGRGTESWIAPPCWPPPGLHRRFELRKIGWLLESLIDYHTAAVLGTELAGLVERGEDARNE